MSKTMTAVGREGLNRFSANRPKAVIFIGDEMDKKEYNKIYRARPDAIERRRLYQRIWGKTPIGKEKSKRWYLSNNGKKCQRAYHKIWVKTLQGRAAIKRHHANRRLKTKDLSIKTVQQVYENNIKKHGTLTCYLCSKPIEFKQDSLEHKIPLSRGGKNNYENLDISHLLCNIKKSTKTHLEWEGN